jgi:pheromone shutdown protein TraB
MIQLSERFHGKDVYLVGTCNQSTMLANRTKKLIEELKPDTVIVQTSEEWWNSARSLQYVDSQEEMNKYGNRLQRYLGKSESYIYAPAR